MMAVDGEAVVASAAVVAVVVDGVVAAVLFSLTFLLVLGQS